MKHILSFLALVFLFTFGQSQQKVEGMVMKANKAGKHLGLSGANVYWLNSPIGTITDKKRNVYHTL